MKTVVLNNIIIRKTDSSAIDAYAFAAEFSLLFVWYKSSPYVYRNVTEQDYTQLLNAKSKGKFIQSTIKSQYSAFRLKEPTPDDSIFHKLHSHTIDTLFVFNAKPAIATKPSWARGYFALNS